MADRIDKIVKAAIEYTDIVLLNRTSDWATAREGLEKMLDSLKSGAPAHPGVERLRQFIAQQDLVHGRSAAPS